MRFGIEQTDSTREAFDIYRYRIFADDRLIAHYWHDYRGDEHGIDFVNGKSEICPVGRVIEFIEGGGPQALALSKRAVDYLVQNL